MNEKVYVSVRHHNFWWGVYGFCEETDWEDALIYSEPDFTGTPVARFCLCARTHLEDVNRLELKYPENEFLIKTIKQFLLGNKAQYHYWYDDPEDDDFWEVPYEAPRNRYNSKPSYIEYWHPSEGLNLQILEESVILFCKKFLHKENIVVDIEPKFHLKKYCLLPLRLAWS